MADRIASTGASCPASSSCSLRSQAGVRAGSGRTKHWPSHSSRGCCWSLRSSSAPPDRRSMSVVVSLGLLALWWCIRSVTAGAGTDFLPLGASIIAFAAAFAAVRPLPTRTRDEAALALAGLGAVGALAGFVGLVWRWFPLAMPAQGLWRLSSSLTYADAAGLVFGICLLLALGCSRAPSVVRVVVCLNLAGLLATQSRGALLAVACGCFLVPARRFGALAVPLAAGLALGVAAIASSPDNHPVPWLAALLVLAVALAVVPGVVVSDVAGLSSGCSRASAVCAAIGVALLVHHEIGLRALAPSDQDRQPNGRVACTNGSLPLWPESGLTVSLTFMLPMGHRPISFTTNTFRSRRIPASSASGSWDSWPFRSQERSGGQALCRHAPWPP